MPDGATCHDLKGASGDRMAADAGHRPHFIRGDDTGAGTLCAAIDTVAVAPGRIAVDATAPDLAPVIDGAVGVTR